MKLQQVNGSLVQSASGKKNEKWPNIEYIFRIDPFFEERIVMQYE